MRNLLLQLHIGQSEVCCAWTNVPVVHGLQLTIYLDRAGGVPERLARRLFAVIRRELFSLGGVEGNAPCVAQHNQIFAADTCAGAVAGLATRVMIYVADGRGAVMQGIQSYFTSPDAKIIPIVDRSVAANVASALPHWMTRKLAVSTDGGDPTSALPVIIRSSGILSQTPSIFVSYVHSEAREVAAQLFHALSARGYAAFLDRFTGAPGDDFIELIDEELANRACLLALETPGYRRSPWCEQEVATAIQLRTGLVALDLPGSLHAFPEIAHRIDARNTKLVSDKLSENDLNSICDAFERMLPHEVSRRPRYQDLALRDALRAAGIAYTDEGLGRCRANLPGGQRLIAMCPGTPDATVFCEIDSRRLSRADPAMIVGSVAAARARRRERVDWLADRSGIDALDEGSLSRFLGLP